MNASENSPSAADSESRARQLSRRSHDLRTPLNTIIGFSQMLLLKETDSSKRQQLEAIHQAGEKLLTLIEQQTTPDVKTTPRQTPAEPQTLTREELRALPASLREQMYQAVTIGDFSQLRSLIAQVDKEHASVALSLQAMADQYDQIRLQALFEE